MGGRWAYLVVEEHGASWLELGLVDEAGDAHIVLGTHVGGHDGVVFVDDLLEGSDGQRAPAEIVDAVLLLLPALVGRLDALLVRDELLLDEEVVLDALELEETEVALGVRDDGRELHAVRLRVLVALLLAHAGGGLRRLPLLLLRGRRAGRGDEAWRPREILGERSGGLIVHEHNGIRI